MKKLVYVLIALSLFIAGCTKDQYAVTKEELKTIKFLNDVQLKELFNGKTVTGTHLRSQTEFAITYNKNGTFKGTIRDGKRTISGKWFVKNNSKCQLRDNGKVRCRKHYMKDGKYYTYNPDRKFISSSFMVK